MTSGAPGSISSAHLLSRVPYKKLPREKVKLPKRQKRGDYRESKHRFKDIKERF